MSDDILTDFDVFYREYPRKAARKDALKAWNKLQPDQETQQAIHDALRWQRVSDQWQRGFIPLPASYLRGERWTDAPPAKGTDRPTPTLDVIAQVAAIRDRKRAEFMTGAEAMADEYYRTHPAFRPSKPS